MGFGNKICLNGTAYMTKVAAMPIYFKNLRGSDYSPL